MQCNPLGLIALVLANVALCDAAAIFSARSGEFDSDAALRSQAVRLVRDVPEVKHSKFAGRGYAEDSPLYETQRQRQRTSTESVSPVKLIIEQPGVPLGAAWGVSWNLLEVSQIPWGMILLACICLLGTFVLIDCAMNLGYLRILGCESAVCLVVFPAAAALATLYLAVLQYKDCEVQNHKCGVTSLFVSSTLNFDGKEPWEQWLTRWYLWHLTVFIILSFKLRILAGSAAQWIPIMLAGCMIGTIWSGFRNYDGQWTAAGENLHSLFGLGCFFLLWFESVVIWCPDEVIHGLYFILLFVGYFAALGVYGFRSLTFVPELFEWSLFIVHLSIVWFTCAGVEAQVRKGTWAPSWNMLRWFWPFAAPK